VRVGTVEDIQGQAEIRTSNGHIVKLQDELIAMRLAEQIFIIDDPELHSLFREFLEEALKESDAQKDSKKNTSVKSSSQGYYRGVKIQ